MSYTLTCPNPDCATVYELPDADFDRAYESGEDISCPDCGESWAWDYDPVKADGEEVTLKCGACEKPVCECELDEDEEGMALVETEEDEDIEEE